MPNAGPPPVEQSRAVQPAGAANAAQQNYLTIVDTLKQNSGAEARAIQSMFGGDKKLRDTFLAVAFSSLASNSDLLLRATPMSIIQSIKDAASLGLKPDGIEGAIVRYKDQAKFMPMYQGYKIRMMRSGKILAVDAKAVYTEDEFDYWTGPMGTEFRHHPAKARKDPDTGEQRVSRGAYMGFYAYARTPEGFVYFRYMDVDQINKIRDQYGRTESESGRPLPWATSYEAMALKTVIRALRNDVPQESTSTDPLTMIERQNDEALAAVKEASRLLDDGLSEVRDLALRAVGALPAGGDASADGVAPDSEEPRSAEPTSAEVAAAMTPQQIAYVQGQTDDPGEPPSAPDPGQDADVRAAMQLAEEQAQLERQRRNQR